MDEHEMDAAGEDEHIAKVRRRAHSIWLDQGMVHGRDQEHWHEAEQEIAAEEAERAATSAVERTEPTVGVAGDPVVDEDVALPAANVMRSPIRGAA